MLFHLGYVSRVSLWKNEQMWMQTVALSFHPRREWGTHAPPYPVSSTNYDLKTLDFKHRTRHLPGISETLTQHRNSPWGRDTPAG